MIFRRAPGAPGASKKNVVSRASGVAAWVGIVVHVALGVGYAFTGLLAPSWAVALLWAVWLGLLVAAVAWRRTHPWWSAAVPVVAAVFWFVALTIGDVAFGWTA